MTEDHHVDRYVNRRKMAWRSFWFLSGTGTAVLFLGLSSDEMAQRVGQIGLFTATIYGVWASVILAYFGATYGTDKAEIQALPDPQKTPAPGG
jgi:hypothetical protein